MHTGLLDPLPDLNLLPDTPFSAMGSTCTCSAPFFPNPALSFASPRFGPSGLSGQWLQVFGENSGGLLLLLPLPVWALLQILNRT